MAATAPRPRPGRLFTAALTGGFFGLWELGTQIRAFSKRLKVPVGEVTVKATAELVLRGRAGRDPM